ncbi:hypothetical protein FRA_50c15380 [Francisella sp. W12-1067]|nr:hypothetical protein FRA_50c15380 [Francisella sp. W12-1067]
MKKKILGLAVLAGTAMLVGCTDPSNSNDALLQSSLTHVYSRVGSDNVADRVGIYQSAIPGFENANGSNPTQVKTIFSGGAEAARIAGCQLLAPDNNSIITSLTATSESADPNAGFGFDSLLGGLDCNVGTTPGDYLATITISFTAGGVSYTATTTLNATAPNPI